MGELEITIERLPAIITVHAAGPVDGRTAASLQSRCWRRLRARCHSVPRSRRVPYMSSAGLRVLLLAAKALRTRGERLRLEHVPPHIQNVLSIAGFTSFIDVA